MDVRIESRWANSLKNKAACNAALDGPGKGYIEYTYPSANHGFHNDTTPRYDKDSAAQVWRRTIEFFRENLV